MRNQITILSDKADTFLIASIGITCTLLAILLAKCLHITDVSPWMWLILVVGVDVSHVYSTLYRTYLLKNKSLLLKKILLIVPIICLLVAYAAAIEGTSFFWTVLVYIAVFHFSRQQIGFLRLFTLPQNRKSKIHLFNEISIYVWTLGSILFWHLHGPKLFQWFVQDDFIFLTGLKELELPVAAFLLFWFVIALIVNVLGVKKGIVSKNAGLLLLSTFVSWYLPIVVFNSDFIFTFSNVISHGIPYFALVYSKEKKSRTVFSRIEIFFSLLILLAFVEEALWDGLIWRDHATFFHSFYFLPQLAESSNFQAVALSLLVAPQLIHYILDGFIWRRKFTQI